MKKRLRYIVLFFVLFLPNIVFAYTTKYIVCGSDRKFPFVFANLFSIVITIIKIFIPVILVISSMVSFFKASVSSKVDDELKKAKDKLINSVIAAIIIFLLLSIVSTVLSIFVSSSSDVMGCVRCLFDPSKCETVELASEGLTPGFGNSGIQSGSYSRPLAYSSHKSVYTTLSRTVSGSKYSTTVPQYKTSADFFRNINYSYYATRSQAGRFYGQCPWYARGRIVEILSNSNIPDDTKNSLVSTIRGTKGNGKDWYGNMPSYFKRSDDIYAAKPFSVVSWSGGTVDCDGVKCGHVGIVEDVEYDSNGKASKILLSEGYVNKNNGVATYALKWWNVDKFRKYYGDHNFIGYVYLLD